MMRTIRCTLSVALAISASLFSPVILPTVAEAQELRGVVMNADGVTPASGVVAVIMHTTRKDSIIARAVTNERGRFSLTLTADVAGNLRLLRIGFEPMEAGTFSLQAGETREARFTLHENRIRLATFDIKATARCQVQPTGAELVAQLFQQARTALIASTTPLSGTGVTRSVNYERQESRSGKLLRPIVRSPREGETVQSYTSIGVDSLEKVGYSVPDGSDVMYYAPDAEVLLSDVFLEKHCLHLVNGTDSLAGSIGIGFRPVAKRSKYVDIQGTLWLDRATSDLQFLEYSYTELPAYSERVNLGGRVEYSRLPNGSWFVSRWYIRMPLLASVSPSALLNPLSRNRNRLEVSGLQVVGGVVQDIKVQEQTLFLHPDAARAGEMPGDDPRMLAESVNNQSSLLDSDAAAFRSMCTSSDVIANPGIITGRVVDESRKPFAGALIRAQWRDNFRVQGTNITWQDREVSTSSTGAGSYLLCGVPVKRAISVFASGPSKRGSTSLVRLTDASAVAQLNLQLEPQRDGGRP